MNNNQIAEQEPNGFCEVAGQKCYLNYCDENGCQDRKRRYTALGVALLHDDDLLKHLRENLSDLEQVDLVSTEIMKRLGNHSRAALSAAPAPAAAGEAWVAVAERLPDDPGVGSAVVLVWCQILTAEHGFYGHGWYDAARQAWRLGGRWGNDVTHWRPLPAPPAA